MDFFKDILPMIFSLIAIVLVLFLSYWGSRYLARRVSKSTGSRNIRIVERAALGQDKGLAIIEVCAQFFLIGFANNNIEILKELPDYREPEAADPASGFSAALMDAVKSRFGPKAGDGNDKP